MFEPAVVISVATFIVGIVGVYYQRRQTLMAETQAGQPHAGFRPTWIMSPAVLAIAALAILAWIPNIQWALSGPHAVIMGWGGVPLVRPLTLQIVVDGDSLSWYSGSHRLIAVAFHYFGDKDPDDVEVQKSPAFDIRRGAITILVRPDETYVTELMKGAFNTNYHLLLVPKGVNEKAFKTIRDAKALGAFDIWGSSGPP